jgi:hypothetical protein
MVYDSECARTNSDAAVTDPLPDANTTVVRMIRRLIAEMPNHRIRVHWVKVRGHSDHKGNDAADKAAMVHRWCSRDGQVSEARLACTFLADDAACLTLIRAVTQLRCFEIVSLGCGLLSCVVCGVSSMDYGFWQSFYSSVSSHSPSRVETYLISQSDNPRLAYTDGRSRSKPAMYVATTSHSRWCTHAVAATRRSRVPCSDASSVGEPADRSIMVAYARTSKPS